MRQITSDMVTAWYNTYVRNKYDDPHEAFAMAIGVSRIEAKKVCYQVAYSVYLSGIVDGYIEADNV